MLRSVKRDSKVSVCKVVVVLLSTYGPSALKTLRVLAPDRISRYPVNIYGA
jgi:hypothetical protein